MSTYARWRHTWEALGAAADARLYRQLIARYREPQRRYHTLAHLEYCFAQFDRARRLALRPAEIELALWFHDAVYHPKREDNEARSAEWARAAVQAALLPAPAGARIHRMILATRHTRAPRAGDARLLVDIDLAILGAAPGRFDAYERRIRAEYAWMPDAEFRKGRAALLRRLLARASIYATPFFRARCESPARANLVRSLRRLQRAR